MLATRLRHVFRNSPFDNFARDRAFCGIDIAIGVDSYAFASDAFEPARLAGMGWNIGGHPILRGVSDPNACFPTWPSFGLRFRIDCVKGVVGSDKKSANSAKLEVSIEELPVLIKNLDTIIAAIGDEQASFRLESESVWRAKLAGPESDFPPFLDEVSLAVEFEYAPGRSCRWIGALPAVAIGDKDIAIRGRDDIAGLVELSGGITWFAGRAETEEYFPIRTEFDNLMALVARFVTFGVGDPYISIPIDVKAMRKHEDAGPKARDHFACMAIEFADRIAFWVVVASASEGDSATSVVGPDVSIGTNVDSSRRSPFQAIGKFGLVLDDLSRWIR